jgi:hypothetical protein
LGDTHLKDISAYRSLGILLVLVVLAIEENIEVLAFQVHIYVRIGGV